MLSRKFFYGLLAVGVLTGCSDKKDEDGGMEEPKGEMEVMTPTQSKEYLQNTATEVLDLFKPADQKDIIALAAFFEEEYADYELPENFNFGDEEELYPVAPGIPNNYIKALGQAARGDMDALTRAAEVYTYRIDFKNFAGVYEPNTRQEAWVKTSDSSDLIFRFNNKSGERVELKVAQSGGTSEVEYTFLDTYEDYFADPSTGVYDWYDVTDKYEYYLSIPKTVNMTLTEGGKQLSASTVVSSIDTKGHTLSADVSATMCNLSLTAKVEGSDSKITANSTYYMNGNKVASAQAVVNGRDLCNIEKIEQLGNTESEEKIATLLSSMLDEGECATDVLGKVQVYGQVSYYKDMFEDMDSSFEYPNTKEVAKLGCQALCDRLNKNIKAQIRYNNTKTNQASILFQPYYDEWDASSDYGWEYYPEAVLLFPDKTTYSIESYFEKFTNVSNKFETLLNSYEKIWESARR